MRFASAIGDLELNLDLKDDSENDSKSGIESENDSENESISSSKIEIATCKSVDQPRDAALSINIANNSDLCNFLCCIRLEFIQKSTWML